MNCDQVFNILTRGPFPSGDSTDSAVEIHLSLCADCRHFADALRPDASTDLESLIPEESRGLPYYWGLAALPGGEQTGPVTATEDRRLPRRRRKPSFFERHEPLAHLSGWQLAFAVLMGALLGTLLRLVGYADIGGASKPELAAISSSDSALNNFDARRPAMSLTEMRLAEQLGYTPDCCKNQISRYESHDFSDRYSAMNDQRMACCTKCHTASAPRTSLRDATPTLIRSCQVCHEEETSQSGYQFGQFGDRTHR